MRRPQQKLKLDPGALPRVAVRTGHGVELRDSYGPDATTAAAASSLLQAAVLENCRASAGGGSSEGLNIDQPSSDGGGGSPLAAVASAAKFRRLPLGLSGNSSSSGITGNGSGGVGVGGVGVGVGGAQKGGDGFQPLIRHAMFGVNFISDHVKQQDEFQRVSYDARGRRCLRMFQFLNGDPSASTGNVTALR